MQWCSPSKYRVTGPFFPPSSSPRLYAHDLGYACADTDPRYLSDPEDVQTLIRGLKTAYKIAKGSPAFNAMSEFMIMNNTAVADSGKEIVDDDACLEEFIRDSCGTLYGGLRCLDFRVDLPTRSLRHTPCALSLMRVVIVY